MKQLFLRGTTLALQQHQGLLGRFSEMRPWPLSPAQGDRVSPASIVTGTCLLAAGGAFCGCEVGGWVGGK